MNIKLNFWIDLATFLGFMVAMQPGSTGLTIHEWFTVAAVGTLIVHFVLHWDWFMRLTSRYFVKLYHSSRLNYAVSVLVFLGFVTIMVSGLMISERFMPFWGFHVDARFAWRRIHDLAANVSLVLVAIHVALRWEWVKAAFVRLILEPFSSRTAKGDSVLLDEDGM